MKQLFLLILLNTAFAQFTFGQLKNFFATVPTEEHVRQEAGIITGRFVQEPFRMFYYDLKGFPNNRFGTGLHIAAGTRKTAEMFGKQVEKPKLTLVEVAWTNQFNFLNTKRFSAGIEVFTGAAFSVLADNAVKEKNDVLVIGEDLIYSYQQETPKQVARTVWFLFKPTANVSVKLCQMLRLQARGGYNLMQGKSDFLEKSDAGGWMADLGVVFLIPSGEQ